MLMSCVIKSASELIFSTYLDPHMHEERHLKLLPYTFAEELHNLTISFHFLRKNTRRYSFSVKTGATYFRQWNFPPNWRTKQKHTNSTIFWFISCTKIVSSSNNIVFCSEREKDVPFLSLCFISFLHALSKSLLATDRQKQDGVGTKKRKKLFPVHFHITTTKYARSCRLSSCFWKNKGVKA